MGGSLVVCLGIGHVNGGSIRVKKHVRGLRGLLL